MPTLKIVGFDGIVPRASPTMLGDVQAQIADNVKLYARELRYWKGPTLAASPATAGINTIWRYYAGGSGPYWLTWTNNVDVVTSPTTDTTDYRIYYTGDGAPKKSNLSLITTGSGDYPRGWYNMGVPAPTAAPTVTRVGSGASPENRVYVYTHVSTFGTLTEESAPSPASASVLCGSGDSVTVNGFAAAPTSNYNITARRIYRSVTGATTTDYEFVTEIPVGTSSYSDSLTAAQLGSSLSTLGWDPPVSGLSGLCVLPTGALCGFSGNTVYFSEPFFPHAWPTAYALNVPHPIVGLGVIGTSVAVMTTRYPYFIHGGIPGQMTVERVPILEPCVSKNTIATTEQGIVYASPNGLIALGPSARGLITEQLFRRSEWQAITPAGIKAVVYDGKYIALYSDNTQKSFVVDPTDIPALSNISIQASAAHVDSGTGNLYYVDKNNNKIYQADADDNNPLSYSWKSKRFTLPHSTSWSVLKLDANFNQNDLAALRQAARAAVAAANAALLSGDLLGAVNTTALNVRDVNGSAMQNLPPDAASRTAVVRLYGEGGKLETTLTVSSWNPIRVPPFKSRQFEIEVVANMDVRSVEVATTMSEIIQ